MRNALGVVPVLYEMGSIDDGVNVRWFVNGKLASRELAGGVFELARRRCGISIGRWDRMMWSWKACIVVDEGAMRLTYYS